MFALLTAVLIGLAGGFINRLRGGGYYKFPSTQLARLAYAIPFGLVFLPVTGAWSLAFMVTAFLGILNGWGTFMDMGRTTKLKVDDDPPIWWIVGKEDNTRSFTLRWLRDFAGMTLRGLWLIAPTAALMAYLGIYTHWIWLPGALMAIPYEIDKHIPYPAREYFGAEFIYGIILFGGIWITLYV